MESEEEEVEEGIKVKYFLSSGAAFRRRRHQFRVTPLKKKEEEGEKWAPIYIPHRRTYVRIAPHSRETPRLPLDPQNSTCFDKCFLSLSFLPSFSSRFFRVYCSEKWINRVTRAFTAVQNGTYIRRNCKYEKRKKSYESAQILKSF